jgi:hypothetical protein
MKNEAWEKHMFDVFLSRSSKEKPAVHGAKRSGKGTGGIPPVEV